MENSIVALDSLLEIQRSPFDKSGLGFQKRESNLHPGKTIKEKTKKCVTNNTSRKGVSQGNKRKNQKKTNQQWQKIKPQGYSTFRKYFSLKQDHGSSIIFERKQCPIVPLMLEVHCCNCHKFGHVASNYSRGMQSYNQHRLELCQQPRRFPNRYNHAFYCYFYSCNLPSHKAFDFRYNLWRRSMLHARYRAGLSNRTFDPLTKYLLHVDCYTFHNFSHMERDYFLPHYSRKK